MKAQHVKGQLFGYRELPQESGLWGVLLPRPGEKLVAHEPDAQDVIEHLDADRLVFACSESVGNRGSLFAFLAPMAAVLLCYAIWAATLSRHPEAPQWINAAALALFLGASVICAAVAALSARSLLPSPIVISRRLRRIYAWLDNKRGWVSLDYDRLVPATFVHRMVTTSGSATTYVLTLCQLKEGSRQIEYAVVPAPAQSLPQTCGQMWEFIRRYMDGDAQALPPVRLVPPASHPGSWMARADREVLQNQVDDEHRVVRRITSMYLVWWYGIVFYWAERARNWIERTAPRRPLPDELRESEAQSSPNGYRIVPYTPVEQQAQAGTLPHMRRRWFICGVLSTALWGALFGMLAAAAWMRT